MVDVLIFGPHPDDIEVLAGGLALSLAGQGYSVGGVDMTAGEAGSRGTAEGRAVEAKKAAGILDLAFRENLGLPDGHIEETTEARDLVIEVLRRHRPRLVVGPAPEGHHPDHARTGRILKEARFLAGCANIGPGEPPWRPGRVLFYPSRQTFSPDLIVDISPYFARKIEAIRAFTSQLHNPDSTEPRTAIADAGFLEVIEARSRYHGSLIGVRYGEAYAVDGPLSVEDPVPLVRDRGSVIFDEPETPGS